MSIKPALQAVLRVLGLCGSRVVIVWLDLWFLVTCGFWLWSARPIVLFVDCNKELPIALLRAMFRFVAIGGDLYEWRKRSWLERP